MTGGPRAVRPGPAVVPRVPRRGAAPPVVRPVARRPDDPCRAAALFWYSPGLFPGGPARRRAPSPARPDTPSAGIHRRHVGIQRSLGRTRRHPGRRPGAGEGSPSASGSAPSAIPAAPPGRGRPESSGGARRLDGHRLRPRSGTRFGVPFRPAAPRPGTPSAPGTRACGTRYARAYRRRSPEDLRLGGRLPRSSHRRPHPAPPHRGTPGRPHPHRAHRAAARRGAARRGRGEGIGSARRRTAPWRRPT